MRKFAVLVALLAVSLFSGAAHAQYSINGTAGTAITSTNVFQSTATATYTVSPTITGGAGNRINNVAVGASSAASIDAALLSADYAATPGTTYTVGATTIQSNNNANGVVLANPTYTTAPTLSGATTASNSIVNQAVGASSVAGITLTTR